MADQVVVNFRSQCHVCGSTIFPHDMIACGVASHQPSTNDASDEPSPSQFHLVASFRNRQIENNWFDVMPMAHDDEPPNAERPGAANAVPIPIGMAANVVDRPEPVDIIPSPLARHSTDYYVVLSEGNRIVGELWFNCPGIGDTSALTDEDIAFALHQRLAIVFQPEDQERLNPASEATIAALPRVPLANHMLREDGSAECTICRDNLKVGDEVTVLPCHYMHFYCPPCIGAWLALDASCCICKRQLPKTDSS